MPKLCFIIARRGPIESKTMFGQVSLLLTFVMPKAQQRKSKHICANGAFNQTYSQLCQLVDAGIAQWQFKMLLRFWNYKSRDIEHLSKLSFVFARPPVERE